MIRELTAQLRLKPPILVRVAHDAKLGPILVKANGHTLYHFSRDQNGKIGCTGACLQFWFPLLVAKAAKLAAVAPGLRTGIGPSADHRAIAERGRQAGAALGADPAGAVHALAARVVARV